MPGLVRGVARTAVIAGTATAVSNRVSRRQGQRWAAQAQQSAPPPSYAEPEPQVVYVEQPAPAPAPAAAAMSADDKLDALTKLGELKAAGILTDAEFDAEKAKILAS
ncbi:MAG: SHOCT domain-containing protein [Ilumatobacteraceae bacterium]|jgi:hypothetical protein|nr:SHOCT domain-containing protein [Ilumatobacteraceae bacterium]